MDTQTYEWCRELEQRYAQLSTSELKQVVELHSVQLDLAETAIQRSKTVLAIVDTVLRKRLGGD